jgi:hypothetical protein
MAEMLILLRRDPQTGRQNIIVKLDSDPDALPLEHEQLHRRLVEKLLAGGAKLEDLGELLIERESEPSQPIASDQPQEATGRAITEPG